MAFCPTITIREPRRCACRRMCFRGVRRRRSLSPRMRSDMRFSHAQGYAPLKLRSALVPAVQLGSWVATPVFFLGMMLTPLLFVGVVAFGLIALFQLITLPVEYNASSRALSEIERLGIVGGAEMEGARKTLNAAALTYVAAVAQTLMTILYFLLRLGLLGGDE